MERSEILISLNNELQIPLRRSTGNSQVPTSQKFASSNAWPSQDKDHLYKIQLSEKKWRVDKHSSSNILRNWRYHLMKFATEPYERLRKLSN